MSSWLAPAITALFLYGFWGFLGARASQLTNTKTVFVISCFGTMIAGLIAALSLSTKFEVTVKAASFSLLTGLATGFGSLLFIYAMQRGPVITIVMITALYPMITVLLTAFFLNEAISLKQSLGILFTMLAIYCLTTT